MSYPKVSNMQSSRGNDVPNQFIITTEEGQYFQSYDSVIVYRPYSGKTQLDENTWDYSITTGKYRNMFLDETKRDIQSKINTGEYILANLNAR